MSEFNHSSWVCLTSGDSELNAYTFGHIVKKDHIVYNVRTLIVDRERLTIGDRVKACDCIEGEISKITLTRYPTYYTAMATFERGVQFNVEFLELLPQKN